MENKKTKIVDSIQNVKTRIEKEPMYSYVVEHKNRLKDKILNRNFFLGFVLFLILVGLIVGPNLSNGLSVSFYPKTCLGGWEHPSHASGQPDVSVDDQDKTSKFNDDNSSVLTNQISDMFCGEFAGDVLEGTVPQKITLHFSMAVSDSLIENQVNKTPSSTDTDPIILTPDTNTTTETPETTETPVDSLAPVQEVIHEAQDQTNTQTDPTPGTSSVDPIPNPAETTQSPIEAPVEDPAPVSTPPSQDQSLISKVKLYAQSVYSKNSFVSRFISRAKGGVATSIALAQETDPAVIHVAESVTPVETVTETPIDTPPEVVAEPIAETPSETTTETTVETPAETTTETTTEPTQISEPIPEPIVEPAVDPEPIPVPENNIVKVSYSIKDGVWHDLGNITLQNWKDLSFDINDPDVSQWQDISKLQIKLTSISSFDTHPVVYLDGMYIKVDYDKLEDLEEPPTILLKDDNINVLSGKSDFNSDENPTFVITDPNLTTKDINDLVEQNKADILQDNKSILAQTIELEEKNGKKENIEEEKLIEDSVEEKIIKEDIVPDKLDTIKDIFNSVIDKIKNIKMEKENALEEVSLFFSAKKAIAQTGPKNKILSADILINGTIIDNIDVSIEDIVSNGTSKQQIKINKPKQQFRPGKYTLKVKIKTSQAIIVSEQDFTWGVLVVNTNKSIYNPGDVAYVQMGVLDDGGHTICVAKLEMEITTPGGIVANFSTEDGSTNLIIQDAKCGPDNFVEDGTPDYHTNFEDTSANGEYKIKLTATTDNGVKVINDKFFVDSTTIFDVERILASRIQPVNTYPTTLKIKSKNAFTGTIVEKVPKDFEITQPQNSIEYDNIQIIGDTKIISWNLNFEAGEEKVLGYYYDAPNISPAIFLAGPLQAVENGNKIWEESRIWQIASDAICVAASSGNWTTVTWTNCGAGPTATDSVQIPNTFSVTLDTSPTVDSIDIQNGGTLTNDGNARTLTLDGTTGTLFTLGGTFTHGGFITVTMTPDADVTATSGAITFFDLNLTPTMVTTNRAWTLNDAALTIDGNFSINPNESAAGTPTLTVNMGGNITVASTKTLTITRTNSAKAILDTRPASTDYNITTGLLSIAVATDTTLDCTSSASTITLTGTSGTLFTKTGVFTITSGTPTVAVTSASGTPVLLSAATTFYHLTINSAATVINQGAFAPTVNKDFTLTSGVYNMYGANMVGTASGTLTLSAGTRLCLGGTTAATSATCDSGATDAVSRVMPASFATYTLNSTSTVSYLSNANTTVTAVASPGYGNLNFRPIMTTTARTYTLAAGLLVQGTLISSPTSSGAAARILTVNLGSGTNTISGAVTLTGRVSAFAGSTTFAIAANTVSMLSVDIQRVTVASILSFSSGTLNLTGTSGTLLTRGGTFTQSTGTVRYTGDGSATLVSNATITFYNLDLVPTLATTNRTYTFGTSAVTIASGGRFTINPTATNASSTAVLTASMGATITVNANATTTIKATQVSSSTVTSVLDATVSNRALSTGFLLIDAGGGYLATASTITLTGITAAANLFTINTGGTFTCGTSTVLVNGVTNSNVINAGTNTLTGSNKLYKLTITASAVTKSLGAALELSSAGTLSITAGTLDTTASNHALTAGKITLTSIATAIMNARGSVITLNATSGTLLTKGALATFTQGTSNVTVASATGPVALLSVAQTFHILTINAGSSTVVVNAAFAVTIADASGSKLYIQTGVFNDSGLGIATSGSTTNTLQIDSGETLCLGGAAGANTSVTCNTSATSTTTRSMPAFFTYTFDAASTVMYLSNATTTISSTPTYGNLTLNPVLTAARAFTFAAGTVTINGNFKVAPQSGVFILTANLAGTTTVGSSNSTTIDHGSATAGAGVNFVTNNQTFSTGTLIIGLFGCGSTALCTFTAGSSNVDITGAGNFPISKSANGVFTAGTSTVTLSASGDINLFGAGFSFYNLVLNGTGVKTSVNAFTITNNFTVSAGIFDPNSGTVTGSGTNIITVNNATIRVRGSTFASSFISFETITLNTNSTVEYIRSGSATVDSTLAYYNLKISTTGISSLNGATTATGTTSIITGATLDCVTGQNWALNTANLDLLGGTFTPRSASVTISGTNGHPFTYSSGTFTPGSSAIIYTGNNSGGDTIVEDGITYYTLEISNASETYDLEGAMTLNNNLKPTAGTLDTTGSNYSITAGRLDIDTSGTFTANDSVITLTATSGTLFTKTAAGTFNYGTSEVHLAGNATTITATNNQAITFYDLYVDPTITAGSAYTFGSGALTINNNFNINPTAASALALTVNMGAAITVSGSTTITKTTSATSSLVTTASNHALTTGTLVINSGGTLNSASSSSVITLSSTTGTLFTNSSGTFTPGSSTVTVSSASGTPTFSSGLSATTLGNVTFSGAATVSLGEALNASGTLTLSGSTLIPGSQTITLSGTGTVFNNTSGTFTAGTSLIKLTNNSASLKTFIGGGATFNNFWFAPSTGTGSLEIRDSNTFADFKDDGTIGHSILFGTTTTQTVTTFTVSGSGSGNKIIINSSDNAGATSTGTHSLVQSGGAGVSSDYLDIQHSITTPSSTWYAGTTSTDNQSTSSAGSGWIFTAAPCRSVATGNWNTGGNWAGCSGVGGIPGTGDNVVISAGDVITQDINTPVLGTLTIDGTLDTSGTNYSIDATNLTISTTGTLTANASTITLSGTTGTLFTITGSGVFTYGTSTVVMNPNASITVSSGMTGVYNLTFSPTLSSSGKTYTTTENIIIYGDFNINPNAGSSLALTVSLGGTLNSDYTKDITITKTGSATTTFDTNGYQINTGILSVLTGATFNAGSSLISLNKANGASPSLVVTGTFNSQTSTVSYADISNILVNYSITYYNLTMSSGSPTYTTAGVNVSNNLTLENQAGLGNFTSTAGRLIGNGSYHDISGTLTLSASSGTLITDVSTTSLNLLGNIKIQSDASVTINTPTYNANLGSIEFSPTLTNNRTYTLDYIIFEGAIDVKPTASSAYTLTMMNDGGFLGNANPSYATSILNLDPQSSALAVFDTSNDSPISVDRITGDSNSTLYGRASTITLKATNNASLWNVVNFTPNTSAVLVDAGDNNATFYGSGANTFYNLSFAPAIQPITATRTYLTGGALVINGDFTINPDDATGGGTLFNVTMGGNITNATTKTFTIDSTGAESTVLNTAGYSISTGNMVIASGNTLTANASAITVADDWTNDGTFTTGTSTVTLNSAATAIVSGTTTFYNLTITHTTAKEVNFSVSGSPIFHVTNDFVVTGHASNLIKLYSTTPATQWNFHPTGTATVDYADVKDGGCEVGSITITPTASTDSLNNDSCWSFNKTITFSISDNSIGFGTLSTLNTRYATTTGGAGTETAAHTLTASTNAPGGYTIYVVGDTLKYLANSIPAIGGTNTAPSAGTAQFGIRATKTGSGVVDSKYSASGFAYDGTSVLPTTLATGTGDDTATDYSLRYVSNISDVTPAGDYSSTLTYLITGSF